VTSEVLSLAIIRYFVFLFSTTCHEAAHALAAKVGGDMTAFEGGQVTLNPVPHIRREPFGMVLVPLIGLFLGGALLGWASAPYDPQWQREHPKRAAWMSLAGPAANLGLVVLAAALIHFGIWMGVFLAPETVDLHTFVVSTQPGAWDGAAKLLSVFFGLNLLLAVFNMLPIPPLDGYSVLALFTSRSAAHRLEDFRQSMGNLSMVALLVGWKLFDSIFDPIFSLALQLLYPSLRYV